MGSKLSIPVDYLFIGLGAANSLLILNMHTNGLLAGKSIGIIEPNLTNLNDRNFCFWATKEELADLDLESLVNTRWEKIRVANCSPQSISPLVYHHIKGQNLHNNVELILQEYKTTYFSQAYTGEPIISSGLHQLHLNGSTVIADCVYDSRPPKYNKAEINQSHLLQSFYGWEVSAKDYVFDHTTMVMMDFDISQSNFCQFMYVLPFTENTALFEVTRFGKEKMQKEEAEKILAEYLKNMGLSYEIIQQEHGVIPMSSSNLQHTHYGDKWLKTGANADMVKPSTGYAFYNMAIDAQRIAASITSPSALSRQDRQPRFKFYDGLLLKILEKKPLLGKQIFEDLFKNVPLKNILAFLTEKSSITQELYMFSKLPILIFIRTALKDIMFRFFKLPPSILAFIVSIAMVITFYLNCNLILDMLLIIGFFTIGLSHGALDHLTKEKNTDVKQLVKFILKYLSKAALLGLIWIFAPDLALILFIMFSAWHFGQADFMEWEFKCGFFSFLWGSIVLSMIIIFHLDEVILVLSNINELELHRILSALKENNLFLSEFTTTILGLCMAIFYKSKKILVTILYLYLCSFLPLLISFGIYFTIQHSMHGWRHLKTSLQMDSYSLYIKSLPYSISGTLIIIMFLINYSTNYLSSFFILLSCMSLPHVISMHKLYSSFSSLPHK